LRLLHAVCCASPHGLLAPGVSEPLPFCSLLLLRGVTDGLLQLLEVHQAALQDLRLEWCCGVQPGTGSNRPCFSEASLAGFLAGCPLLRSVRLRHSASLSAGFAQQLASSCPLLQLLVLDQCDLLQVGEGRARCWLPFPAAAPSCLRARWCSMLTAAWRAAAGRVRAAARAAQRARHGAGLPVQPHGVLQQRCGRQQQGRGRQGADAQGVAGQELLTAAGGHAVCSF
jgi:hypothetical protein